MVSALFAFRAFRIGVVCCPRIATFQTVVLPGRVFFGQLKSHDRDFSRQDTDAGIPLKRTRPKPMLVFHDHTH